MISMFKNSAMAFVLMFSSMSAFAGINGGVGVNSDNYFRGHNISDGLGYSLHGKYDFGKGMYAGAKMWSLADDADGDHLVHSMVGWNKSLSEKLRIGVAYSDIRYQGGDADGWEEMVMRVSMGSNSFLYRKGLDNAGDMYEFHTGMLKVVDLSYGDWDDGGSFWHISKGWDMFKGHVKVGYIDHEDNADDFADKLTDLDNFYVGYSYKF